MLVTARRRPSEERTARANGCGSAVNDGRGCRPPRRTGLYVFSTGSAGRAAAPVGGGSDPCTPGDAEDSGASALLVPLQPVSTPANTTRQTASVTGRLPLTARKHPLVLRPLGLTPPNAAKRSQALGQRTRARHGGRRRRRRSAHWWPCR